MKGKNRRSWIAALVLALTLGGSVGEGAIRIEVAEKAIVAGPDLTLGELAQFQGDEPERIASLAAARLGQAPGVGSPWLWTPQMLGVRLEATKLDFGGVEWQVPAQIEIARAAQTVAGAQISAEAVRTVRSFLAGVTDVEVELIAMPEPIAVPRGQLELRGVVPVNAKLTGPVTVKVEVRVDGRYAAQGLVRLQVKQYQEVYVAARDIRLQEAVTAEQLRLERMDIGTLPQGYWRKGNKLTGWVAARNIAAGTPLHGAMLRRAMIIQRGAAVHILSRSGNVEVQVSGQALQDGYEGQWIRVQNQVSRKVITAKVIDETTVSVLDDGR